MNCSLSNAMDYALPENQHYTNMILSTMQENSSVWCRTQVKKHTAVCQLIEPDITVYDKIKGVHVKATPDRNVVLRRNDGITELVTLQEVAEMYVLHDGKPVTMDNLKTFMDKWYKTPVTKVINLKSKESDMRYFVTKFPLHITNLIICNNIIVNKAGENHGTGDYLLAENKNGVPDLRHLKCVNGLIFDKVYSVRGISRLTSNPWEKY